MNLWLDSSDRDIFFKSRLAGSLVMTKDRDFIQLLNTEGPPPKALADGETWVEIRQSSHGN